MESLTSTVRRLDYEREKLRSQLEEERKRRLREIMEHAQWEARMAREHGQEWFRMVAEWKWRSLRAAEELLKDPAVREALLETLRKKDERSAKYKDYLHPPGD